MTKKTLGEMIEEWNKELFEERSGIKQYMGNTSREDAEREAYSEIRQKVDQDKKVQK